MSRPRYPWIHVRTNLAEDPRILALARRLGCDRFGIVGRLVAFWGWADKHTADGRLPGVTVDDIDALVECPGFAAALCEVQPQPYLIVEADGVRIPRWETWLGQSARRRLLTARRVREYRQRRKFGRASPGGDSPERQREDDAATPASDASAAEVVELLTGAGVERVVAERLARGDGRLTRELVEAAVAWADEQPRDTNRAGFVVAALRHRPAELERRVAAARDAQAKHRAREAERRALAEAREVVRAIPDARWGEVVRAACERIRRRWPHSRPERRFARAGRDSELLDPALVRTAAEAWRELAADG